MRGTNNYNDSQLLLKISEGDEQAFADLVKMYSGLLYTYLFKITKDGDIDAELIENYAFLSSLHGKYEEALLVLSESVREGKNDTRVIEQVKIGYAKLNPGKDANAYVTALQQEFIGKIRNEVSKSMINQAAPDFYIKDVNGKKVILDDFKGKTIVLDFWASWCTPCRAQARELIPVYEKYKSLGFEVIGVSLDTDASAWKRAINADKYTWTNISDMKGFESSVIKKYGIVAIPGNFIIDNKGVVVAMDLHGKLLEKKLSELF